ncbi:glycosyltransferase family 87 protein [Corynebacterium heidelbergense]|nr:glycosyltransferase 87 family protein [Corynebacterium heidelbergense]
MGHRHGPVESDSTRVLPGRTEPLARGFIGFLGGPMGDHALVGRARWGTPLRVLLLTAAAFLSLGWMQKAQCLRSPVGGGAAAAGGVDWSGNRQFTSACYSDTVSLFSARGLDQLAFPYLHSWQEAGQTRYMEYPVLTGLFQWFAAVLARPVGAGWRALGLPGAADVAVYFGVSALFLAAAWMAAVGLTGLLARRRVWDAVLMAASPLIIVHAFTNFDTLSVLAAVAGLWLWSRNKPAGAGVALAVGVALKLWPVFIAGAIVLLCLRARAYGALVRFGVAAVIAWLLVNVPIMVVAPAGWAEFFRMNSARGLEGSTLYAVAEHIAGPRSWLSTHVLQGSPAVLNAIGLLLLGVCLAALAYLVLSAEKQPRLAQVAFLAVLAFLVTNKVWSPQYSLWLLPLLVLALPRWRLVFGWAAVEAVYWYLRMWQFLPPKQAAPNYLVDTVTVLRIGLLLWMAGVVLRQIRSGWDEVRAAHDGADPLAGPLDGHRRYGGDRRGGALGSGRMGVHNKGQDATDRGAEQTHTTATPTGDPGV